MPLCGEGRKGDWPIIISYILTDYEFFEFVASLTKGKSEGLLQAPTSTSSAHRFKHSCGKAAWVRGAY